MDERREHTAAALLDAAPPSGGAAAMGTGIVSVGLALDHHATLSGILFGIGAALWLGFAAAALRGRVRWHEAAKRPTVLTAVAATAVVGARLALLRAGWACFLLLALACALWLVLVPAVLRSWRTPTVGVFPLGMYAACSLTTGRAIGACEIAELGRIWVWVALAAWTLVFAGMLGRARRSIGT